MKNGVRCQQITRYLILDRALVTKALALNDIENLAVEIIYTDA
jgi:hypothetical protein